MSVVMNRVLLILAAVISKCCVAWKDDDGQLCSTMVKLPRTIGKVRPNRLFSRCAIRCLECKPKSLEVVRSQSVKPLPFTITNDKHAIIGYIVVCNPLLLHDWFQGESAPVAPPSCEDF